jgi:hypothetical protein
MLAILLALKEERKCGMEGIPHIHVEIQNDPLPQS